jgi:hypothetical protein
LPTSDQNEAYIRDVIQTLGLGRLSQVAFINTCAILQFEVWYATIQSSELLSRLAELHFAKTKNTIKLFLPGHAGAYWHIARYTGKFTIPSAYQLATVSAYCDKDEILRSFLVQQVYFRYALQCVKPQTAAEAAAVEEAATVDNIRLRVQLQADEIVGLQETITQLEVQLQQAQSEILNILASES